MSKVIIAGSRGFTDYSKLCDYIKEFKYDITEIVSGGANGVDKLGERFARENNIPAKIFPAKWTDFSEPCLLKKGKYGDYNALAGHNRNREMAEYADVLLAINLNTPGTNSMIKIMKELNKPAIIFFPLKENHA